MVESSQSERTETRESVQLFPFGGRALEDRAAEERDPLEFLLDSRENEATDCG